MAIAADTKRVAEMAAAGRADELTGADLIVLIAQNIGAFEKDDVLRDPVTWELHPETIVKLMTKTEILAKLEAAGVKIKGE